DQKGGDYDGLRRRDKAGEPFCDVDTCQSVPDLCSPIWAEPFGQVGNHRLKSREVTRHSGIDRVNLAKQNREYQIEAKSDRCDSEQGREPSWGSEVRDFDTRKALDHCLHEVPEENG